MVKLEKTFGRTSKSFIFQRISSKYNSGCDPKVTSIPIENIKALQAKNYSNNLAFVTTFNSNNKNVFPLIQTALSPYNTHMKQKNVSKILS